jgi:hypothetical protein
VAFDQSPEGCARERIAELEWKSLMARCGSGEISAAEQTELDHLRTLYPDLPLDPDDVTHQILIKMNEHEAKKQAMEVEARKHAQENCAAVASCSDGVGMAMEDSDDLDCFPEQALGQESEHGTTTLPSGNFFSVRSEICTGESSSRLRSHSRNMRRGGWPTGFPARIASNRFASISTPVVINIASDRATRESPGSTTLSERPGRAAIRSSNGPLAASAAGKLSLGEAAELMGG